MSTTILSQYPFSHGFQRKLEHSLGDAAVYLSVSEIRELSLPQIWHRLRSIRSERIVIPLENDDGKAVLPFLKLLAAVSSAPQIEVIFSDMSCVRTKRWSVARDLVAISSATVKAQLAVQAATGAFDTLLRTPRIAMTASDLRRVLYINANLWLGIKAGGSVGHTAGVANALSKFGYQVDYASPTDNKMLSASVKRILLERPTSFAFPPENTQYLYDRIITNQLDSIATQKYGFIYQRMSLANCTGVRLSRKYKIPLVLEYNGSEVWAAKNWGRPLKHPDLAVKAEDVCLRHAHLVVTISNVLKEQLEHRGVEPERIACYPNCIDEEVFNPGLFTKTAIAQLRARYGISEDALVVGFIGTFGLWHGADILASAIHRMVSEMPEWLAKHRVHFLLIGDGAKMSLVRQALGTESPFWKLTGLIPQADAPVHLAATDILVSPHIGNPDGTAFFGSPTKLFEYMVMGKAIIASDLDQIGQVLEDSVRVGALPKTQCTGSESSVAVLCRPGNSDDLIQAIRFAVEHPAWRSLLGRNAREKALNQYTWQIHVRKILETLNTIQNHEVRPAIV